MSVIHGWFSEGMCQEGLVPAPAREIMRNMNSINLFRKLFALLLLQDGKGVHVWEEKHQFSSGMACYRSTSETLKSQELCHHVSPPHCGHRIQT